MSSSFPPKQARRSFRQPRRSRGHLKLEFSQRPQTANSATGNFPLSLDVHDDTQSDPEDFAEKHDSMRRVEQGREETQIKIDGNTANDVPFAAKPDSRSNHSPRKQSRHASYSAARRHKRPRVQRKEGSNAGRGPHAQISGSIFNQNEPTPFDAKADRATPTKDSEQAIMDTLERVYNFSVHQNASLNADNLILFKTSAQPTERLHALITAMHAELFLAMSFIDREPAPFDFVDPVTIRWKELVLQDLLVEIMPRVGGFLQQLGYEVGMAMNKHDAGVRTYVGSRQTEAGRADSSGVLDGRE